MRQIAVLLAAAIAATASAADKKGTKVTLGGVSSVTPATWVAGKGDRMRMYEFRLPKVGSDKEDAEVVIFAFGGGAKANLNRWKGQFKGGSEGKVTELKIGSASATRLEIDGTFTPTPRRFGEKVTPQKGYKGVFYYLGGLEKDFQIRLVGPEKTVEHYKKGYDEWMKGFKK